jgi:hypothetical protein
MRLFPLLLAVLAAAPSICQVAPPASPMYEVSEAYKLFESFAPEKLETVAEMAARGAIECHDWAFFGSASNPGHSKNTIKLFESNMTELKDDKSYLPGTTYWVNDYLHVGHVTYDIGVIAVAQAERIDRIVMQRAACHGTLCVGLGSFDSFYKGYYAAVLSAAGQIHTPIYLRFDGKAKSVIPMHLTTDKATDYYNASMMKTAWNRPVELYGRMHFERVIHSSNLHYGAIAAVSAEAVKRFKAAAYALVQCEPPLTTYFESGPPYTILLAYRGNKASRQIQNMGEFEHMLRTTFPSPTYVVRLLNNSDPYLAFDTQLQAVAEAHVVLANHGAFEGNMIYMRNASLLVELFGNYGNNEIHGFQRLAIMFGLYYARLHAESLVDHQAQYFNLSSVDLGNIKSTLTEYFERKPYLLNLKPRTSEH